MSSKTVELQEKTWTLISSTDCHIRQSSVGQVSYTVSKTPPVNNIPIMKVTYDGYDWSVTGIKGGDSIYGYSHLGTAELTVT